MNKIFAFTALLTLSAPAWAHDHYHPDLNSWYQSLVIPGTSSGFSSGTSCCNLSDCHVTEADQREGEWWAQLGFRVVGKDGKLTDDWTPGPWVKIPKDRILQKKDNPVGGAVICHQNVSEEYVKNSGANTVSIFCFVVPNLT